MANRQHAISIMRDKKPRSSNLEALRIVAMCMIIFHHILFHVLHANTAHPILYSLINPWINDGVNLFFFISGYFTIRYSGKGLARIILTVLYFGLINYLILYLAGVKFPINDLIKAILFPVSDSQYWFMKQYVVLIASAPLLNAGLRAMRRMDLRRFMAIFIGLIIYSYSGNATHNYLNAMFCYCIGFYLRDSKWIYNVARQRLLVMFVAMCLAECVFGAARAHYMGRPAMGYDNVFVIASSIALFAYFLRLDFTSAAVNRIAGASLGVYLLQDGVLGNSLTYRWLEGLFKSHASGIAWVYLIIGTAAALWLLSFALTRLQNIWIGRASESLANGGRRLLNRVLQTSAKIASLTVRGN